MRKKILILFLLLAGYGGYAQSVEVFKGFIADTLTTAEINALPDIVKRKGAYFHNKDIGSLVTWDGSAWVVATGSGLSNVVEDTTPQWGGNMDPNGNYFGGDFLPAIDSTYNLGSGAFEWKYIYGGVGFIDNIQAQYGQFSNGLALNGTSAFLNITPTDSPGAVIEGKMYADDSENRPKYYDGTGWKAFLLDGDVTSASSLLSSNNSWTGTQTFANDISTTAAANVNLQNSDIQLAGNLTAGNSQTIVVAGSDPTGQASLIFNPAGAPIALTATPTDITYNGTSLLGGGGASQLSDLSDVNTSTPTNRNVLVADGVDFESRPLVEADISDLGSYVDLTTNQSIGGEKTFTGTDNNFDGRVNFAPIVGATFQTGYGNISFDSSYNIRVVGSALNNRYIVNGDNITAERTYTLPDASGTIALTSDITGSSLPVDDTTSLVQDPVDNTKTGLIDVGNVATASSATLSLSNDNEFVDQVRVNGSGNTNYTFEESGTVKGSMTYVPASNYLGFSNSTSVESLRLYDAGGAEFFTNLTADSFIKDGATSDDVLLGDGTTTDKLITSDITGVTGGTQYSNVYGQTEAGQIADGTPPAGTLSICTDCYPYIEVALSDYATDLTTGTSKAYWRAPFAMEVMEVRASVLTAPTGANIIVDINESGTSIMTTNKLSIDATEKTSTTAATAAGITDANIADDAEITFDIDQIGSTIAGAGLLVKIYYK